MIRINGKKIAVFFCAESNKVNSGAHEQFVKEEHILDIYPFVESFTSLQLEVFKSKFQFSPEKRDFFERR